MTNNSNETPLRPRDIAQWMYSEIDRKNELYQEDVVQEIKRRFGAEFTYTNRDGGESISKPVLRIFRTISGSDTVWERGAKLWRRRHQSDKPGRQQD